MTTQFLSDLQIEGMACRLLGRYGSIRGRVSTPPVPIERIVEDVLDLNIVWDTVPERQNQTIVATLDPYSRTILFNESRRTLIDETPGLYNTALAHEAGHWMAHVDQGLLTQQPLPEFDYHFNCLFHYSRASQEPREAEAHKFMGFLLMPSQLLSEVTTDVDLLSWPALYGLRGLFQVTITALRIRLEQLNRLYVTEDGQIYPSRQEYDGQMRLAL